MKKAFVTSAIMMFAAFLFLFSYKQETKLSVPQGKQLSTEKEQVSKPVLAKTSEVQPAAAVEQAESAAPQEASAIVSPEMGETLEKFFNEMPRTDRLKKATDASLHETPQAVLAAGEVLANVHEYFETQPQPRDIEMSFYLKCSQQKDFFDSIRAVCAARLSRHYLEATGHEISSEIFDQNVDRLRREINL